MSVPKTTIHRWIYIGSLLLMVVSLTTSTFLLNLGWVIALCNWVFEGDWQTKSDRMKHSTLLHAFAVIFIVTALWCVVGNDHSQSLFFLQRALPLIAIPLVALTSEPLNPRERNLVTKTYIYSIAIVTLIGIIRWIAIDNLPYRQIAFSTSNIRLALHICVAICLIAYDIYAERPRRWVITLLRVILIAWFIFTLLMLRSYTAFAVLSVIVTVTCVYAVIVCRRTTTKIAISIIYLLLVASTTFYIYRTISDYYEPTPLGLAPLPHSTVNGRPYCHANDGLIENGAQVNNYICEEELRMAWPKVSSISIDSTTDNNQSLYLTLIRYMGSRGLTKDSAGVMALTHDDIAAIEHGVANHVIIDGNPARKMIYTLLFEYENYRVYHNVDNSSLGKRLLLWESAYDVFLQHPLIGVGTGHADCAAHEHLSNIVLPEYDINMRLHNQYLSYLVDFGIIGLVLIIVFFLRSAWCNRRKMTWMQIVFIAIILTSCLDDDTLTVTSGIMLCTVPIAFLRTGDEQQISN